MYKLSNLLTKYANQNKVADEAFVETMAESYIDLYNLFFNKITYESKPILNDKTIPMTYCYAKKTISIDLKALTHVYASFYKQYASDFFSERDLTLMFNAFVVQAFLHEIDHIIQFDRAIYDKGFEGKLFKLAFSYDLLFKNHEVIPLHSLILNPSKNVNLTHELYLHEKKLNDQIFYERYAQINSLIKINYILENVCVPDIHMRKITRQFKKMLEDTYQMGYDLDKENVSPYNQFISLVKGFNDKNFNKYIEKLESFDISNMDVDKKYNLGLNLDEDERRFIKRRIFY